MGRGVRGRGEEGEGVGEGDGVGEREGPKRVANLVARMAKGLKEGGGSWRFKT